MIEQQTIVAAGAVAALGAASGSFINVVVERTHALTSPWRGRSACPKCRRTLSWFELVPVLSWLALRGKCRTCRARISHQYPLMELLTAAAFFAVWVAFDWSLLTLVGWGIVGLMIALTVYDAKWSLLPDEWSYAFVALGLVATAWSSLSLVDSLIGGAVGAGFFGLQWLASRGRWVGSGDILLGLALGTLLGWRMVGLALLIGYMSGALVAAIQILRRRLTLEQSMPFGPYLLLGGFVAWLYGNSLVDWYFNHAIFR